MPGVHGEASMNIAAQDGTLTPDRPAPAVDRAGLRPALESMTVDQVRRALREALDPLADELRETAERTLEREQREFLLSAGLAWPKQRASIENTLPERLARALSSEGRPDAGGKRFDEIRPSWDELGLVDDGVIEDDLRFGEIVTRIRNDAGEQLVSFDQRMGALLGQPELSGEANPFAPRHLIRALREALAAASLDPRIKRRVMEAMTRVVCPAMVELYRNLDTLLRDRGVHPAAVSARPVRPRTAPPPAPVPAPASAQALAPADGAPAAEGLAQPPAGPAAAQATVHAPGTIPPAGPGPWTAPATFEAPRAPFEADPAGRAAAALATGGLLGFLATLMPDVSAPSVSPPSPVAPAGQGSWAPAATGEVAAMPALETETPGQPPASASQISTTNELISVLTSLQRGTATVPGALAQSDITAAADVPATTTTGAAALNVLHGLKASPLQDQMGQMDLATLDVMALLFDQIFGDTRIPAAMKALIARLQIPALKVAVLDKTFFSRKSHPARRVLDLLGEIALGLGERFGPGEPLHDRIESLLLDLMAQFEDDMSVFDRVAAELGEILGALNERAEEQSRHHAARVQRSEELNNARRFAREALGHRLAASDAPRSVARFLSSEWNKLLVLARLHQGEDGPSVRNLLKTVDVLLWSLEPKRTVEARKRFVALLPTLLRHLSLGMETANTPPRVRQRVDSILLRYHTRAISTARSGGEQRPAPGTRAIREDRNMDPGRTQTEAGALARLAEETLPPVFDTDPYAGMPEAEAAISSLAERGNGMAGDGAGSSAGQPAGGSAPRPTGMAADWRGGQRLAVEPEDTGIVWFTPDASAPGTPGKGATADRAPRTGDQAIRGGDESQDSGITWFIPAGDQPGASPSADAAGVHATPAGESADPTAALQPGVWVEIHGESGDPVQARLSIVSPHRSTFVFSDRAGGVVAEYSAYQVETYLRSGRLAVIPEAPLIERALGNLVGLLRGRAA